MRINPKDLSIIYFSGGVSRAIEIGAVDEMIDPDKTRSAIAKILAETDYRRGSHGNIPL